MKAELPKICILILSTVACAMGGIEVGSSLPELSAQSGPDLLLDSKKIQAEMLSAFDWQIQHLTTDQKPIESSHGLRGWVHAAFTAGVMKAYKVTHNPAYRDYAWKSAELCQWKPGPQLTYVDDLACTQTYLDLYRIDSSRASLQPTREAFDQLLAQKPNGAKLLWWCDSLFMMPPALARLGTVTKDPKYRREMERLYQESKEFLYDPSERLFFRDKSYMQHDPHFHAEKILKNGTTVRFQEKNGKKMFWSRGNGWVLAGLTFIIEELPKDDPQRGQFEELFKSLAERLRELQPAEGLWRMGLLDQEAYGHGEASGSGFFVYGFAWGVKKGLLDRAEFSAAIEKGWHGLEQCQKADGMVGYVQPIGTAPGSVVSAESSQEYGTGAFLMAGAEVVELLRR